MPDEATQPGPWNQNQTTRVSIGPITFEITTAGESSHVPVPEEKATGAGIQKGLTMLMAKLEEILAAQCASTD